MGGSPRVLGVSVARAFQPEFCPPRLSRPQPAALLRVHCGQLVSREAAKPRRGRHEVICDWASRGRVPTGVLGGGNGGRQAAGMSVVFPAKVLCKTVNAEPDSAGENSKDQSSKGADAGASEPWQVPAGIERRQ